MIYVLGIFRWVTIAVKIIWLPRGCSPEVQQITVRVVVPHHSRGIKLSIDDFWKRFCFNLIWFGLMDLNWVFFIWFILNWWRTCSFCELWSTFWISKRDCHLNFHRSDKNYSKFAQFKSIQFKTNKIKSYFRKPRIIQTIKLSHHLVEIPKTGVEVLDNFLVQIDTKEGSERIKIKSNQINVYYRIQLQYDNKSIGRGVPNSMRVYYTLFHTIFTTLCLLNQIK